MSEEKKFPDQKRGGKGIHYRQRETTIATVDIIGRFKTRTFHRLANHMRQQGHTQTMINFIHNYDS